MANSYRGVSPANETNAGFRAATGKAVDDYKAKRGLPKAGKPVQLRVADMYVTVQNPIHEYIVVLEPRP